jgi:hypothetical protein
MDLKALIAKMDQIEAKQILNESVSMPAEQLTEVAAEPVTVNEGFKSSIAKALLVEFGLTEADAWTPTPEQEKWLGGANRQDPYIINRMPGAKPPSSYFTDPADQAKAKQMGFDKPAAGAATKPAAPAAPTGTTAQGDDEGNTMITKPDGTTQVVGPDGNAIKPGSNPNLPQNKPAAGPTAGGAATKPAAGGAAAPTGTQVQTDDDGNHMITTPDGKSMVVGPDGKPLPNGGKVDPAAPATAAATKPAAGGDTARPGMKPGGTAAVYDQQKALVAQGAKIATDGIMGPQTQAAIKQFGSGTKPGADAAGAKPAAGAVPAGDAAGLKRFKELLAKTGGGAATKPAAAPAPAAGTNPATTSSSGMDFSQVSG